jgi:hypothetical protein
MRVDGVRHRAHVLHDLRGRLRQGNVEAALEVVKGDLERRALHDRHGRAAAELVRLRRAEREGRREFERVRDAEAFRREEVNALQRERRSRVGRRSDALEEVVLVAAG